MITAKKNKRRWDLPTKRSVFQQYVQGVTSREIERRMSVPAKTVERWAHYEHWQASREKLAQSWSPDVELQRIIRNTVQCLDRSITVASKALTHIERRLDGTMNERAPYEPPGAMQENLLSSGESNETKEQSSNVPEAITTEELATLARALKDSSDVLLRIFDK